MNSLFLKLIQPFPIKLYEIKGNDLSEIKSLSLNSNLFPLAYAQLQKYQNSIFPTEITRDFLQDLKGLYLKSVSISIRQETVEDEILSLLRSKGIQSTVIKGNAIAREIYDDPNCRISSDIDILIRKADAGAVDAILAAAGYIAEENIPLAYCLSRIHHASYHHPRNNMLIEIHWGFGVPYFFNLNSQAIWNEITIIDSGRTELSSEMLLIMLLIHHHSHAFREVKILVDILWALYKYENIIDWDRFAKKLKKIGLAKTTIIALYQIRSLWEEPAARMKSLWALERVVETKSFRTLKFLLSYFKINLDATDSPNIYKDKLIARLALDKWSTILLSYVKTLVPVPVAIKELYKDRRDWALPVNYVRFIHWRLKEWLKG